MRPVTRHAHRRSATVSAVLVGLLALVLSACVSIPNSSSPQPIESLERHDVVPSAPRPSPGMDPESLVRSFLKATANPASGHVAARQFLTSSAMRDWDDRGDTIIISDINVLIDERSDTTFSIRVVGDNDGSLGSDGHLTPGSGRVETRLTLIRENGQWRIDSLPSGVLLDRSVFQSLYRSQQLYFPNHDGDTLTPDPRWLFQPGSQLADQLVGYLVQGPSASIGPAVQNPIPAGASLRGSIDVATGSGVELDFSGLSDLSEKTRELLAAEVIWTLAKADVAGPYRIDADGAPLMDRYADGWVIGDVGEYDPSPAPSSTIGLHVIRDGALLRQVDDSTLTPVTGTLGSARGLLSAAISSDDQRAAGVIHDDGAGGNGAMILAVGAYNSDDREVARGATITRPSFGGGHNTVWAVIDGRVTAAVTDPTTGQTVVNPVDASSVPGVARGAITELQVSRDSSRAAMIVGGQVVVAAIAHGSDGKMSLVQPGRLGLNLSGEAVSLDWVSGDTLVVALDDQDNPIVQIPINGSPAVGLLNTNLTPPVRAVVADTSTIYAGDSRGVLRLGTTNGEPDQYWNEVGPTMGTLAIPVLP